MKLTVCLELFFGEVSFVERIGRIKAAGYDAGEFWGHDGKDLRAIAAACKQHGVTITSISAGFGIAPGLNDAAAHEQLMGQLEASIIAAQVVGCKRLIVVTGNVIPKKTRCEQSASIIAGLRRMAPLAQKAGMTLLLELLNSRYDHPGYFLDNSEDMAYIIRAVNHPSVKALYDIYHAGIMEGNIIENIRANIDCIGHFHAAGIPGRHEPALGEQNYPAICRAIDELGFSGFMGLEYVPTLESAESLRATLKWIRGRADSGRRT